MYCFEYQRLELEENYNHKNHYRVRRSNVERRASFATASFTIASFISSEVGREICGAERSLVSRSTDDSYSAATRVFDTF
jgi:hypothetical protein